MWQGEMPVLKYPQDYEIGETGQANTTMERVLHWNVHSINKWKDERISFIKRAEPLVVSLQETWEKIPDIAGYKVYHAEPRICKDHGEKYNAVLIIRADAEVKQIHKEVDMIVAEVSAPALGITLLTASFYAWKNKGKIQVIDPLNRLGTIIAEFREKEPTGGVLIMGDMNMDERELREMSEHMGVSTLTRMGFHQVGYTCVTRRNMGQI
jgi:exonuclease III